MTEPNRQVAETLLERIAAGDRSSAVEFYDSQAGRVRMYCQEVCTPELTDEATLAAFVDFLGRAGTAPPDADSDDLMRKAARAAASARMDMRDANQPECIALPELIAAEMSGELPRGDSAIAEHLARCPTCVRAAERLQHAEGVLARTSGAQPPVAIRREWLQLVTAEQTPETESGQELASKAISDFGPTGTAELVLEHVPSGRTYSTPEAKIESVGTPEHPSEQSAGPATAAARVRARRGGLVGAARRLGSSKRGRQ